MGLIRRSETNKRQEQEVANFCNPNYSPIFVGLHCAFIYSIRKIFSSCHTLLYDSIFCFFGNLHFEKLIFCRDYFYNWHHINW